MNAIAKRFNNATFFTVVMLIVFLINAVCGSRFVWSAAQHHNIPLVMLGLLGVSFFASTAGYMTPELFDKSK
ncbi:hypothetical protein OVY01_11805 [Robbsia sp. Bb-Pol-6]|uniref:Uncharacterized protein n=1 Tax=Robbsia betulipollinis TaxID=2981849 RepID=A0ABT3ZNA8_9BURK|nr:hypothetical protein [Robbsia betulipollinis]MCY0387907.1 hypothetical protein [Robbsia betulipollinis]